MKKNVSVDIEVSITFNGQTLNCDLLLKVNCNVLNRCYHLYISTVIMLLNLFLSYSYIVLPKPVVIVI